VRIVEGGSKNLQLHHSDIRRNLHYGCPKPKTLRLTQKSTFMWLVRFTKHTEAQTIGWGANPNSYPPTKISGAQPTNHPTTPRSRRPREQHYIRLRIVQSLMLRDSDFSGYIARGRHGRRWDSGEHDIGLHDVNTATWCHFCRLSDERTKALIAPNVSYVRTNPVALCSWRFARQRKEHGQLARTDTRPYHAAVSTLLIRLIARQSRRWR